MGPWHRQATWDARPRPDEPGHSLRAEVRRQRDAIHRLADTLDRVVAALNILGTDAELLPRLSALHEGLQLHRQVDAQNGHHEHHLGKAVALAASPPEDRRHMQAIKKRADAARHSAFEGTPPLVKSQGMPRGSGDAPPSKNDPEGDAPPPSASTIGASTSSPLPLLDRFEFLEVRLPLHRAQVPRHRVGEALLRRGGYMKIRRTVPRLRSSCTIIPQSPVRSRSATRSMPAARRKPERHLLHHW